MQRTYTKAACRTLDTPGLFYSHSNHKQSAFCCLCSRLFRLPEEPEKVHLRNVNAVCLHTFNKLNPLV